MDKVAATHLIAQTFDSAFNEQTFETFIVNMLNQVNRGKSLGYRSGNIIPQAFRGHISTYRRPFVYYDPNGDRLDVLIVRLSKITGLDRARTMQRNFAAWYLKQEHGEIPEAALFAFYHGDVNDWRFSFVRLEYAFGDDGAEENLTPARRYSFLVGPTEPTHTAESQLHPFLIEDATDPLIVDLAAAFQIETVSKQFFEEYKELFLKLVEGIEAVLKEDKLLAADFKRAEIYVPNFAKKLLGQIVFLYFVQKKGWLGVIPGAHWGSGPKDFLRRLFAKENGVTFSNFFNDVLEPLFYEALAVQREGDLFASGGYTCQIPFLNGGLFEPMGGYDWHHTSLLLPNTVFSNRKSEDDDQATGILDVFDRYNFTVWEEEPLEKEVAVDPEMLGKVFENLLEVQDRKSKGAFYTPREIVHYMCQESLINYLDTSVNLVESGLADEKPVQASMFGNTKPQQKAVKTMTRVERLPREDIARLMRQGALALQQDAAKEAGLESGDYVLPQTVRDHARELDDALAKIKLCDPAIGSGAFPVGMLHEIVQARQALGTYLGDPNRPPYPLKWHAIQESIYGVDIDAGAVEIAKLRLWLSLVVDEENYNDIQPLPNLDYKIVCGNSLQEMERDLFNVHLFVKLDELMPRFFIETHHQEKAKLKAQIDQLIELLTGTKTTFDFGVYFHRVFAMQGGFDVVLGNPPYVRQERIRDLKPTLRKQYPAVYAGTADLYVYFYVQGTRILRQGGTLAYITSNKFMRAGYGRNLREFLGKETTLHAVIDFGDLPVFDATAYPSIVMVRQQRPEAGTELAALTVDSLDMLEQLPRQVDEVAWLMPQAALKSDGWALVRPDVLAIMEKLRRKGKSLAEYIGDGLSRGVLTGYNEAFVIDEATRNKLVVADPRSADVIKPWVRGRDIKRWSVNWDNYYVIAIQNSGDSNANNPWSEALKEEEARRIFQQTYPAIHDHLSQYEEALIKRYDQGQHWWELRACAYFSEFARKKIIYPHFNKETNFAYETEFALSNDKTYIIPDAELYLLGILNSRVSDFFLHQVCPSVRGDYMEFRTTYVGQTPIPQANPERYKEIEELVRQLLEKKKRYSVKKLEREIDLVVYQLFDLNEDETKLIEREVREENVAKVDDALGRLADLEADI